MTHVGRSRRRRRSLKLARAVCSCSPRVCSFWVDCGKPRWLGPWRNASGSRTRPYCAAGPPGSARRLVGPGRRRCRRRHAGTARAHTSAPRERANAGRGDAGFHDHLVDPGQMRLMLEELLRRQDGLTLVSAVIVRPNSCSRTSPRRKVSSRRSSRSCPTPRSSTDIRSCSGCAATISTACAISRTSSGCRGTSIGRGSSSRPPSTRINDIVIEVATLSLDEEWIGVWGAFIAGALLLAVSVRARETPARDPMRPFDSAAAARAARPKEPRGSADRRPDLTDAACRARQRQAVRAGRRRRRRGDRSDRARRRAVAGARGRIRDFTRSAPIRAAADCARRDGPMTSH